jgi:dTMP kinase
MLGEWLRQRGVDVLLTREPGGTPVGEEIRDILLRKESYTMLPTTEALLMTAARAQHVGSVIHPALRDGMTVVCDRFTDSTLAYQGGGRGLPIEPLRSVQQLATDGLEPDLRILLDVPVDIGLSRRMNQHGSMNRIDAADLSFHERVRSTFLALAAAEPNRWAVIDATLPAEDVARLVWHAVNRLSTHTAEGVTSETLAS